ncbi:hypothetical protein ACFSM7_14370 [Clavibacter michiganensis subsp. tessellarius]
MRPPRARHRTPSSPACSPSGEKGGRRAARTGDPVPLRVSGCGW